MATISHKYLPATLIYIFRTPISLLYTESKRIRLDQQINLDNLKILRKRTVPVKNKAEAESSSPPPPPAGPPPVQLGMDQAPPYHGDSGVDE